MNADWFIGLIRIIFFFLDKIIYPLIADAYELLMNIANTTIFTEEIIDLFASKVYALLGIFMLFKVSFSIMTYIVNPDDFTDKKNGAAKMISNVVITLVLLVTTPWIFSQAMDIQRIVLKDNIIGKVFSVSNVSNVSTVNVGNTIAFDTLSAFYKVDVSDDGEPACVDITSDTCENYLGAHYKNIEYAYSGKYIKPYMDYSLLNATNYRDSYIMSYQPVISTIAGGFILWILVMFCFDIAVRSVKIGFLRMIAPIPIISRIDPKKGTDTFNKWVKSCVSTYLDLFIRLLAIYFAVFVISLLGESRFEDAVTGLPANVGPLVKVFIIMGALLFAKQLPQLIEELTGIKLSGKFTLNPMKKLREVPLTSSVAGGIVGGIAGTAGSIAAHTQLGHNPWRTAFGTVGGFFAGAARGAKAGFNDDGKSPYLKKSLDAASKGTQNIYKREGTTFVGRNMAGVQQTIGVDTKADKIDKEIKEYDTVTTDIDTIFKRANSEMIKNNFNFADSNGNATSMDWFKREKERLNILRNMDVSGMSQQQQANHAKTVNDLQTYISKTEKLAEQAYVDEVVSGYITDVELSSYMASLQRYVSVSNNNTVKSLDVSSGNGLKKSKDAVSNAKVVVSTSSDTATAKANRDYHSKK